jgi:trehalose/maltose hydrolase-like predicted phosphorylase
VYIFPFYNAHFPEITRALLMYRYRRLSGARKYARENGYQGAMYPWQTADDGDEETQIVHYNPVSDHWGPDLSRRQRHVSIAIFYNVWRYWERTGDTDFLEQYGAEMMLEIARFWASAAKYEEDSRRYHIEGVMGPDEYHEKYPGRSDEEGGIKDNAYTNILTVWLLERTLEMLDRIPAAIFQELVRKTGFDQSEMPKWHRIIRSMAVTFREHIISQFDGYRTLPELDWDKYRKKYPNIERMDRILKAEGDSPDKYKVSKQADTLMAFYLLQPEEVQRIMNQLGYAVDDGRKLLKDNYEYYVGRTSHGSTLSKVVHAAISKDIQSKEVTWEWFMQALRSDVYDTQGGTTLEGIHCGVMAGTLWVILRNFAGLTIFGDTVSLSPALPDHWRRLKFSVLHRGVLHRFEITRDRIQVGVDRKGKPFTAQIPRGHKKTFRPSAETRLEVDFSPKA